MGAYSEAAEFYDLLYSPEKDYAAEGDFIADLVRAHAPHARTILDVGCGTGQHARHLLDLGFEVDGVDLEPAFARIARAKCPRSRIEVGDMASFSMERRYDAVLSLFSAIGYMTTVEGLCSAVERMAAHLNPGGVVIVDPWFEPGALTDGWVTVTVGSDAERSVCRMSRTVLEGSVSRLDFEYLIGSAEGIERRSETHRLGLFSQAQMEHAFDLAGLRAERLDESLRPRGTYVATAR